MPNFPKNPDGMKPSGFKMKGSPHKMGTIQGTSGHASALKQATLDEMAREQKLLTQQESLTQTKEAIAANNKVREKAAKKEAVKKELKTKGVKDDKGMYILGEMESAETTYDPNKSAEDYKKESKERNLSPEAAKKAKKKNKKKLKPLVEADAKADAKAKVDATRGTERGQVKKSGKLDNIQARQDKKALKKFNKNQRGSYKEYKESVGEGEGKLSKKDWKAQNKANATSMEDFKSSKGYTDKSTRREERLKKEVNMTPEEYKANQAEKKQKFQDAMNRTAMILHPNFDPSQVAEFDEGVRRRGQAEETERINNEYKAAETKRIESGLDAYKAKKAETDQLFKDESNTVNKDGSANMENTDK